MRALLWKTETYVSLRIYRVYKPKRDYLFID